MVEQKKRYFRAEALFAGCNSAGGFRSFYREIFFHPGVARIYIIKGGPGTGKSHLMQKIATLARERGYYVESYRCSSDPDSLDGILLEDTIAVIDGTAPHAEDTEYPGAREEIVPLGLFWDAEKLAERYEEIVSLGERKRACYRRSYRYLSAAGEVSEANRALSAPLIREEKMKRSIERMLFTVPRGEGFSLRSALTDAVGMKGIVHGTGFSGCAQKLYAVEDWYGTAPYFLDALISYAEKKEIPLRLARDPVLPSVPQAVFFCHTGDAFVIREKGTLLQREPDVLIKMKRFVAADGIKEIKDEWRRNLHFYEALLGASCDALAEAGEAHFALEQIYVASMDYEAQNKYVASLGERILTQLENLLNKA